MLFSVHWLQILDRGLLAIALTAITAHVATTGKPDSVTPSGFIAGVHRRLQSSTITDRPHRRHLIVDSGEIVDNFMTSKGLKGSK
jgi:hypothetical protein